MTRDDFKVMVSQVLGGLAAVAIMLSPLLVYGLVSR